MVSKIYELIFVMALAFATIEMGRASDPDILTDFIVPEGSPPVDGNFFTFTGMRQLVGAPPPEKFKVLKATLAEFPALNGQSVSMAVLEFPGGSVNPPHTHPRASELLFLLDGGLQVGIVDTTNKLYTQTLQEGDMFIFPKGLVHFQFNIDASKPAMAVSAFGSASAGTVSIPNTVFNTSISDGILAKSFKTDISTIQKLKAGLAH
ncbi:germin-like protein 9-3 [Impatiens glandulifera]|uniref:germin-like protein 9-3 n=1 Tax=Impatiens glandulifera TaxID=253017 RepID=UPI001FB0E1CF|nr:germin-like protein 9-3 [Impatiens glandulifera]